MLQRKLRPLCNTEKYLVYWAEINSFDGNNQPVYGTQSGYYFGTYRSHLGIRHIVTNHDSLFTTVVDHIPDSRCFETEEQANEYVKALQKGLVTYEKC